MTENIEVQRYFEENADSWLLDAYAQSGHNYPTPFHRVRVAKDIFRELHDVDRVIDVGCGGGQLALALAGEGYQVTGVDQSATMLESAHRQHALESKRVQALVSFQQGTVDELPEGDYDALTAMGLIGYLQSDDVLFGAASRVLRRNGYVVVSFRNRLFNLFSVSSRTLADVEGGEFEAMAREASLLYQDIDTECVLSFLRLLHSETGRLLASEATLTRKEESPSMQQAKPYSAQYEARQSTPQQAIDTAQKWGFDVRSLRGVHPHFAVPGLNELLPPQIYNRLSDSLIPLEASPVSLLWSSVFVGVFEKVR